MRKRAIGWELTVKKGDGVRNDDKIKSDRVTVQHGTRSDGVRVHDKKTSDRVRVLHEK